MKAEQANPFDGRWEESGSAYCVRYWGIKAMADAMEYDGVLPETLVILTEA